MFLGERLLYLELPRTASRHTRGLLASLPCCRGELIGMHNRIYNLPAAAQAELGGKLKFGGIRNPWDWYVGLWASGWLREITTGQLPEQLRGERWTPAPASVARWRAVHEAPTVERFREFLRMLLATHRREAGHNFHQRNRFSQSVGFMTFRYIRLYTTEVRGQGEIGGREDLARYDERHNLLDAFVRFEHIAEDLLAVLEHVGISEAERETVRNDTAGAARRRDYRPYYDEASYRLVLESDGHLIEKHRYRFDPPAHWTPPRVSRRVAAG